MLLQRRPYATSRGGRSIHYVFPDEGMAMGAAPRGLPSTYKQTQTCARAVALTHF
jgi:hypothetical protein